MRRTPGLSAIGRSHSSAARMMRAAGVSLIVVAALALPGCSLPGLRRTPPPPPLKVSEVVEMCREGVPAKTVIHEIRESETVYRLTAAQLAHLHDEGVPDSVLKYMQQTYVDSVRKQQRLQDEGLWEAGPDGYLYGGGPFGWPDEWMAFPDDGWF